MTNPNTSRHMATLTVVDAPVSPAPAGTAASIAVVISCTEACDLRGTPIVLLCEETELASAQLTEFVDGTNESGRVPFTLPALAGEHQLQVRVADHTGTHAVEFCTVPVTTVPHEVTTAVWDLPFPLDQGAEFSVKVGVACSCGCRLSDHSVEIRDAAGKVRGTARLSETPWPQTAALHWADVRVIAPPDLGDFRWTAVFVPGQDNPPHTAASSTFGLRTTAPAEFALRVRLAERASGQPVAGAELRVGRYEAFTNDMGEAAVNVPGGPYLVQVRKDGIAVKPMIAMVRRDRAVVLKADVVRTHDELVHMMQRFEGDYWRP